MKRMLCLVSLLLAQQAQADWLSLCHGLPYGTQEHRDSEVLSFYINPDTSVSLLRLTEQAPKGDCRQLELPLSRADVEWAGISPRMRPDMQSVSLQGSISQGHFAVSDVILPEVPQTVATTPVVFPVPAGVDPVAPTITAAWFWSPGVWLETPQRILDAQAEYGLNRVYITVPVSDGVPAHAETLSAFLRTMHQARLQVWAVLGDPRAVLDTGRQQFVGLAAAYEAYNQARPTEERLDGLQLDIETYLLPGYWLNVALWQDRYAYAVNSIHQAASRLALDLVLPFWFEPQSSGIGSMLQDVSGSISSLTIMDYRTEPGQIRQHANQFLEWGTRHGKAVNIALETGHIPIEDRRHYRKAISGELWRLKLDGKYVLILLGKQHAAALPEVDTLRYSHSRQNDGNDITFDRQMEQFRMLLPKLLQDLSKWPSFSGIAVHGIDQRMAPRK